MPDQFYTVQELAAVLKLTDQAIYKWIRQDKIAAVRFGRTFRITTAEAERVIREGIPEDGDEDERALKQNTRLASA